MADATVLKTVEGNLVRVRLPSSAPRAPQIALWGVLFFVPSPRSAKESKNEKGAGISAPFSNKQDDVGEPYGLFGQQDGVDDVDDTIAGCNVGDDDLDCFVQEHFAIFD